MKPLTIDELKALGVGDWVWVVYNKNGESCYEKIAGIDKTRVLFYGTDLSTTFSTYGKTWIAYKNKEQAESKGEIAELPCLIDHLLEWHGEKVYQKELVYRAKNGYISTTLYGEDEFSEAERRLAELKGEQI